MADKQKDVDPKSLSKDSADRLLRYRVTTGGGFVLADRPTSDLYPTDISEKQAITLLEQGVERLSNLQEKLYADRRWSVLVILQGMDAAGKDSTIKHVLSGVNPQGVRVTPFKAPSADELAHDFLWRINQALPARGMIGVFNRSQYEDVLVARVHPEVVGAAHLPESLVDEPHFWDRRLADIAAFERHLAYEGTRMVKIFLHISRDEQKKRLLARLDDPDKLWKFDAGDLKERAAWPAYREAYQEAIARTATSHAPWYVVPADRKWYARLIVIEAVIDALAGLDLKTPSLTDARRAAQAAARTELTKA